MSLKDELSHYLEKFLGKVPEQGLEIYHDATAKLIASGIAENCLKVGDKIPQFSLPNVDGKLISSDELLARGPLIINFYRGGWCGYCNLELQALQRSLITIKETGATLVAISPNLPNASRETVEKHALEFDVLNDLGNKVSTQYGVAFTLDKRLQPLYKQYGINLETDNGDNSQVLPLPATFVANRQGEVVFSFVDADYTKRVEPSEVIAAINAQN